jgi:hypothetical protein
MNRTFLFSLFLLGSSLVGASEVSEGLSDFASVQSAVTGWRKHDILSVLPDVFEDVIEAGKGETLKHFFTCLNDTELKTLATPRLVGLIVSHLNPEVIVFVFEELVRRNLHITLHDEGSSLLHEAVCAGSVWLVSLLLADPYFAEASSLGIQVRWDNNLSGSAEEHGDDIDSLFGEEDDSAGDGMTPWDLALFHTICAHRYPKDWSESELEDLQQIVKLLADYQKTLVASS